MFYLFLQTWGWILAAFILGLCFGWWLCGRCSCKPSSEEKITKPVKKKSSTSTNVSSAGNNQPLGLTSKPTTVDDLKRISGVGTVLEKKLHSLGIYTFQQIADFTKENIDWVDDHLSFHGRIERDDWIGQAKKLAAGKDN